MIACKNGHGIFKKSCRSCQDLKRSWYTKLEAVGFNDIEKNQTSAIAELNYRKNFKTTDTFEITRTYYDWARSKLSDSKFQDRKDKLIWKYHSEGFSRREIAPIVGFENSWVGRKIDRIKEYLIGSLSFAAARVL